MKFYDISVAIKDDMPVYPGDPRVSVERVSRLEQGDSVNVACLHFSAHTGTHIDAPRHFLEEGATVDRLPLEILVGRARVVEIAGVKEITREELARLPLRDEERLLLKTGNSSLWVEREFVENYAHLTEDGARYLVERGVRLVGIDYLSIEKFQGSGDVHRMLLGNNVLIVEGLDLSRVPPGEYELFCLPLKMAEGDGAPARAILRGEGPGGGAFDSHTSRWPLS